MAPFSWNWPLPRAFASGTEGGDSGSVGLRPPGASTPRPAHARRLRRDSRRIRGTLAWDMPGPREVQAGDLAPISRVFGWGAPWAAPGVPGTTVNPVVVLTN